MKKIILGAFLTLGIVTFVGCADKAASTDTTPASKCGGEKKADSKCGGSKSEAKKCGAENNGKCGSEK